LAEQDVVPLLRADLLVARSKAPCVFELRDPESGAALTVYEYELSVARMLDGRRRVADVIENGRRLGIPIDPVGLGTFIRQLAQQRFLSPPGWPPPSRSQRPWSNRQVWDQATREQFQRGVRLVRQGRPDDAAPIFQQMLADDPEAAEAHEMLAIIAAGHTLLAHPIGEVFASPAERAERSSRRTRLLAAAGVLSLLVLAALAWWVTGKVDWRRGERRASTSWYAEPGRHSPPLDAPLTVAPHAIPVDRRWHPTLAELRAPADGVVAWVEPPPYRLARGSRLGEVRAAAEPGLEARAARSHGLEAPMPGLLVPVLPSGTRVLAGDLLARIVDGDSWRLSVLVRGEPPPIGARWELSGGVDGERTAGVVVGVRTIDSQREITLAVTAAAAPWLEGAGSPRVLFPPPEPAAPR
jgi:hypothetical protein